MLNPGTYKVGRGGANFFKRIFYQNLPFSVTVRISLSHIMVKFDIKCMLFTFFSVSQSINVDIKHLLEHEKFSISPVLG